MNMTTIVEQADTLGVCKVKNKARAAMSNVQFPS